MPARKGATAFTVSLPDGMLAQLELLAASPEYGSRSRFLEALLARHLAGSATQTTLDQIHQRLDRLTQALKDVQQTLAAPPVVPTSVDERLTLLERQQREQSSAITKLLDQLRVDVHGVFDAVSNGREASVGKGWFRQ